MPIDALEDILDEKHKLVRKQYELDPERRRPVVQEVFSLDEIR